MKFWIDTEFNQTGGDLISIALVGEQGQEFYAVLPCDEPKPWIAKNVMPILYQPAEPLIEAQKRFSAMFSDLDSIEIVADHPADLQYFNQFLIVGNEGQWLDLPPIAMWIDKALPDTSLNSKIPHNALEDARALRAGAKPIQEQ